MESLESWEHRGKQGFVGTSDLRVSKEPRGRKVIVVFQVFQERRFLTKYS